ncbi:MAG: hypothetical protein N3A62_01265 [Thermodesulfovibrionales bacterium]|nr:hypothetical protein [Thermodesulfovibrionales bacterium]
MLTNSARQYIYDNAYLPEHMVDYVMAVSQAEPFIVDDYLFFIKGAHLIFVGYALDGENDMDTANKVLDLIVQKQGVKGIAILSPFDYPSQQICIQSDDDYYYRLNLADFRPSSRLRNSIRRAQREVTVSINRKIDDSHLKLIDEVVSLKLFDDATKYIFKRIPAYLNASDTVEVFNAINKEGKLIAFDIADYGSKEYCFYMFNLFSRKDYVPGVSDLLLYSVIETAIKKGKIYLNMGLGIDSGNEFFKKKWGAVRFIRHCYCYYKVYSKKHSSSILNSISSLFRRNS